MGPSFPPIMNQALLAYEEERVPPFGRELCRIFFVSHNESNTRGLWPLTELSLSTPRSEVFALLFKHSRDREQEVRIERLHPWTHGCAAIVQRRMSSFDDSMQRRNAASSASHSHHDEREEGVLKDVLDELDRERSRRAELEEQVRKLQEDAQQFRSNQRAQQQQARSQNNSDAVAVSQRVFVSMEAQVEGYQQLVDALTLGKPAIAAAAKAEESLSKSIRQRKGGSSHAEQHQDRKTLPLHVVRLLEVLPWDPRAKQYIFAVEEIFEWQVYQDNAWQSQLRFFPTMFKTLPLVKATATSKASVDDSIADQLLEFNALGGAASNDKKDHRSFLSFLAGGDMQSPAKSRHRGKNRIITNERVTALYDLDAGYPLPNNEVVAWEWIGGWRVGTRASIGSTADGLDMHQKGDCDQHGWSYVVEAHDFLLGLTDMVWDNPGVPDDSTPTKSNRKKDDAPTPTRPFRRRRWTRQRVLVDYLYASKPTQQYLKLLAENARLTIAASKISDQLVETKLALTETEEKLMQANDLLQRKNASLQAAGLTAEYVDLKLTKRSVDELGVDSMRSINSIDSKNLDFGSKFTQWVQSTTRKTSEDMTSLDESIEEASLLENNKSAHGSSSQEPQQSPSDKFDWTRIGRARLLNKLKPNIANSSARVVGSHPLPRNNSAKSPSIFRQSGSAEVNNESANTL
jgi:hypothetical protein